MKPRIIFIGNYFKTDRAWEEIPERLSTIGYSTFTTSDQIRRTLRLLDMISTIIKNLRLFDLAVVDVFSGLSFFWAELVTFLLKRLNKRYVLVLRGGGLVEFSLKNHFRAKKLLTTANAVVTPSYFLKKGLFNFRTDITYLPNGLDLQKFEFSERKNVKPSLVWLRALHYIYQPEVAIRTLSILKKQIPRTHLLMVGQDKRDGTRENVEDLVRELDLFESFNWIGSIPRNSVPETLKKADIFLNTTLYEGFGTSVLEAAACGLCIVTTNVGELPYFWEEGVDALLVPPNDPEAMAAAVTRILTEPGLAARLSANARIKAERYDWSVIIPQWEALFEKVFTGG